MCGIFAYVGDQPADPDILLEAARAGRRGPHAHGWIADGVVHRKFGPLRPEDVPVATRILGHARLATYGNPRNPLGIQPILVDGHAIAHNGNIDNWASLWPEDLPSDTWALAKLYAQYRRVLVEPATALVRVMARAQQQAHAIVILDSSGALITTHHRLPLFVMAAGDGIYLSSAQFLAAIPASERPSRLLLGRISA